jgi:hypothetical protein
VLRLTLEATCHTAGQLATRTAAAHEQPTAETLCVARSPEGQTAAERAAAPESQGALPAVPPGTILKEEGEVPPMEMRPDAFVKEGSGAIDQSAITTLTTTADALSLAPVAQPIEEGVLTATQPISPAADKSAPATTTEAAPAAAAAAAAAAASASAAATAAAPSSTAGAGPQQKPASGGQKRKRDTDLPHVCSRRRRS